MKLKFDEASGKFEIDNVLTFEELRKGEGVMKIITVVAVSDLERPNREEFEPQSCYQDCRYLVINDSLFARYVDRLHRHYWWAYLPEKRRFVKSSPPDSYE